MVKDKGEEELKQFQTYFTQIPWRVGGSEKSYRVQPKKSVPQKCSSLCSVSCQCSCYCFVIVPLYFCDSEQVPSVLHPRFYYSCPIICCPKSNCYTGGWGFCSGGPHVLLLDKEQLLYSYHHSGCLLQYIQIRPLTSFNPVFILFHDTQGLTYMQIQFVIILERSLCFIALSRVMPFEVGKKTRLYKNISAELYTKTFEGQTTL